MSKSLDNDIFEAIVAASIEAGKVVHDIYRAGFDVQHKADQSPVTDADHAAEAVILKRLKEIAPQVPVIAEEEVAAGRIPSVGSEFFLVDPLDGTKEFIQKRGDFTVNIAKIHVAKRDHVLATRDEFARIGLALPAAADQSKVDRIAGRVITDAAQHVTRDDHRTGCRQRRTRYKFSSGDLLF